MWEWLKRSLRDSYKDLHSTRTTYEVHWRRTTNRPLTPEEIAALDRAFDKFDEGFKVLDEVFGEWRR